MEKIPMKLYAIIHIGSVYTSLHIFSYSEAGQIHTIEEVTREVGYGEEVFQTKRLCFESLNELCQLLLGFRQLILDYGVCEVNVVGTTAIREAENSLSIIDQIRIRTGFTVNLIDMTKEIYYKFFGLYKRVIERDIDFADETVLLMDITSGGLGATGWKAGTLLFQQNVQSGSLRIMENFDKKRRNELTFPLAVREYIHGMLSPLWESMKHHKIKYVILSGIEAGIIVDLMGEHIEYGSCILKAEQFFTFVQSFDGITPFKLMKKYGMSESRANVIMPTILLYDELLRSIGAETILFTGTTFLEGYSLYYVAEKENTPYLRKQRTLLMNLARSIAARYVYDQSHSYRIEQFSVVLFRSLYKSIGLNHNTGYLLRLASIFHEMGKFINLRHHYRYTYEVIMGTDVFGISDEEKEIVANIAFYSYKGMPSDEDPNFKQLSLSQKMIVMKLVAIFRLADALDQGHNGKITRIDTLLDKRQLIVSYRSDYDVSLERWTFEKAGQNFEEVFGITPILKKGMVE